MAEYVRGLDNRDSEESSHNNNGEHNTRSRIRSVDFNAVNFEQRRGPYGNSGSRNGGRYDDTGNPSQGSGNMREDV